MRRLLSAHLGVVIAITATFLLGAAASLALILAQPPGVATRPGTAPPAAVPSPTVTPAQTPSASATPSPTSAPACVDPVATWSLAQRLAQLMIVGGQFSAPGGSTSAAAAGVGGFVFFGQPPAGSGPAIQSGLAGLAAAARTAGQVAPWMSTDEEGGQVQRLAAVLGPLPSPRWMAANWSPSQVQSAVAAHALALRRLGISMDLAPVVDTASPGNPIADESDRSFSEDGQVAAAYGVAYADGLRTAGVIPVAKHFPGMGHADANTDLAPATDPPLAQLGQDDLVPFEAAVAAGEPAIMVSHVAVPDLTGRMPASLSGAAYRFLRGTLGFHGLAMTDSLAAVAIASAGYSEPAAAVAAVEAGADMVMVDATWWQRTLVALEQAAASGALTLSRVNEAVARIVAAKNLTAC